MKRNLEPHLSTRSHSELRHNVRESHITVYADCVFSSAYCPPAANLPLRVPTEATLIFLSIIHCQKQSRSPRPNPSANRLKFSVDVPSLASPSRTRLGSNPPLCPFASLCLLSGRQCHGPASCSVSFSGKPPSSLFLRWISSRFHPRLPASTPAPPPTPSSPGRTSPLTNDLRLPPSYPSTRPPRGRITPD